MRRAKSSLIWLFVDKTSTTTTYHHQHRCHCVYIYTLSQFIFHNDNNECADFALSSLYSLVYINYLVSLNSSTCVFFYAHKHNKKRNIYIQTQRHLIFPCSKIYFNKKLFLYHFFYFTYNFCAYLCSLYFRVHIVAFNKFYLVHLEKPFSF